VNVAPIFKRLNEGWYPRDFRNQSQFDLRIINADQFPSRVSNKGAANLASVFGADRNVLQIRFG
jgi:hypothetical protein